MHHWFTVRSRSHSGLGGEHAQALTTPALAFQDWNQEKWETIRASPAPYPPEKSEIMTGTTRITHNQLLTFAHFVPQSLFSGLVDRLRSLPPGHHETPKLVMQLTANFDKYEESGLWGQSKINEHRRDKDANFIG